MVTWPLPLHVQLKYDEDENEPQNLVKYLIKNFMAYITDELPTVSQQRPLDNRAEAKGSKCTEIAT